MKHEDFHSLPGKPIREYIQARQNEFGGYETVGVMVGASIKGAGFSAWNADYAIANAYEGDKFDPDFGTRIAYGRAMSLRPGRRESRLVLGGRCSSAARKVDIANAILLFLDRCAKYYKDCEPAERVKTLRMQCEEMVRSARSVY